jgi:uncharacterized phiE125 gp8 family phage protein
MALQLITPPSAEPIHLNDAITHIKQTSGVDDSHITASVIAARKSAENATWRQLVSARYKQVHDSFPGIGVFGVNWGHTYQIPKNAILLERLPVQLVESIQYIAMDGTTQTVDPSIYTVDYSTEPCRITPKFGQIWPIPLPQIGAVWVTFIAGFAAPITADATADTISISLWKTLSVGDAVRFTNSGGALPSPLKVQTDYYIAANPSAGVYQLSATSGGAVIDIADVGTGNSFIGEMPDDILAWIKLRIGSLDIFREEAIAMNRGKIETLPFVDSLLDSYARWW